MFLLWRRKEEIKRKEQKRKQIKQNKNKKKKEKNKEKKEQQELEQEEVQEVEKKEQEEEQGKQEQKKEQEEQRQEEQKTRRILTDIYVHAKIGKIHLKSEFQRYQISERVLNEEREHARGADEVGNEISRSGTPSWKGENSRSSNF